MREGVWRKTKVVGGEVREMKHVGNDDGGGRCLRVVTGVAQYVRRSCLGVDHNAQFFSYLFVCRVELPSNIIYKCFLRQQLA